MRIPFSWELQTFFLSKKGLRRSESRGRSKNTTAVVIHYPVVFLVRLGPLGYPKGPNLENFQSRLKSSISLEIFNPDLQNSPLKIRVWWVASLKFSISLENFNPDLQNSPLKIGVWWVARLKFSISLENFKILTFFNLWALRVAPFGRLSHWLWGPLVAHDCGYPLSRYTCRS